MIMPETIKINQKGVARIKAGHLWVFRNDLESTEDLRGGEIVRVLDNKGNFLGKAFYSSQSLIALRFLTREDRPIDESFWGDRISTAYALRQKLKIDSNAYRIVFAESDLLSSIIIDKYDEYLSLQTLSQGSESVKASLTGVIIDLFKPKGILERNDAKVRTQEGLEVVNRVVYGDVPECTEIFQGGIKFLVDLRSGQKTGLFLDQRENYVAAASYAHGRFLDCFSYAGGFSLHASPWAEHVISVDVSSQALSQARRNAELNHQTNMEFIEGNCFDLLHSYDKERLSFDMVILDPPAFAKNKGAVKAAMAGYKEINLRAMKLLAPGGMLVTCSCSYHMSEGTFWQVLLAAAGDAGRTVQIVEKRTQARDHPILLSVPESYYLKCFILRVL